MERELSAKALEIPLFSRHFSSLSLSFSHIRFTRAHGAVVFPCHTSVWYLEISCYFDLKQSGLMPVDYNFFNLMKVVTYPSFCKRNLPDSIDIKEALLGVNAILFFYDQGI